MYPILGVYGHVKFVTKNHLHTSLRREITFLCDNFGYLDGATWHASWRDLATFDAPRSTPEHQYNLARDYAHVLFPCFQARTPPALQWATPPATFISSQLLTSNQSGLHH